jgi:hypothetical protein
MCWQLVLKSMFVSLQTWVFKNAGALLIAALGVAAILHLTAPVVGLPLRISKAVNEGWNAFQALAVATNQPLYPDLSQLHANNYPPLSFYLIATLGCIESDYIVAGRFVALVSFLIVGLNIALITRRLGGTVSTAIFSGLFFVGFVSGHYPYNIATNEPQWLAHALVTTGFLVFLDSRHQTVSLIVTAVLFVVAGMVKLIVIPLPLAVTIWLFKFDRRRFWVWSIVGTALVAASMALCYLVYGSHFIWDVFAAPRQYQVMWSIRSLYGQPLLLSLLFFPIILALIDCRPVSRLVAIYALTSGAWGTFIMGGAGVDNKALFDLTIAISIAAGLTIDSLAKRRFATGILTMFVLTLAVISATPSIAKYTWAYLQSVRRTDEIYAGDVHYLAGFQGAAICDDLALCYWAGKDFELDLFSIRQKLAIGTFGVEEKLIEDFTNRRFAVIQSYDADGSPYYLSHWPQALRNTVSANYRVDRQSISGFFLIPRTSAHDGR